MAVSWTCWGGTVVYKNNVGNESLNSLNFDNCQLLTSLGVIVTAAWRVN